MTDDVGNVVLLHPHIFGTVIGNSYSHALVAVLLLCIFLSWYNLSVRITYGGLLHTLYFSSIPQMKIANSWIWGPWWPHAYTDNPILKISLINSNVSLAVCAVNTYFNFITLYKTWEYRTRVHVTRMQLNWLAPAVEIQLQCLHGASQILTVRTYFSRKPGHR